MRVQLSFIVIYNKKACGDGKQSHSFHYFALQIMAVSTKGYLYVMNCIYL